MQYIALQDNEKSHMLWKEFRICQLNINDPNFFCPLAKNSPCLIIWWHWLSFKNIKILHNDLENFKTVVIYIQNILKIWMHQLQHENYYRILLSWRLTH